MIALDAALLSLWRQADARALNEIVSRVPGAPPAAVCAALACLAEANLLVREQPAAALGLVQSHAHPHPSPLPARERGQVPSPLWGEGRVRGDVNGLGTCPAAAPSARVPIGGDLVSAVIVSYNSRAWLNECLVSLCSQTYSPLEIVIVDNASADDSAVWVEANYPQVKLVRLAETRSLAHAINRGVAAAAGEFFLILNPDVRLEPDAAAQMMAVARDAPAVAAVAAKLKFAWAPAFLNGLGNYVGGFYWSSDNALGHLDVGQFDALGDLPSACFAAALIPRRAWEAVGPLDEAFPLYYEDSEWCYRARRLGYSVRAAPQAIVYHAMGGRAPSGEAVGLSDAKLRSVVYGRLRFAVKLLGLWLLLRFLTMYLLEDIVGALAALLRFRWGAIRARLAGWRHFLATLPALLRERRSLAPRWTRSDRQVLRLSEEIAPPLTWRGLPELTWDLVCWHYLPLFLSKRTRRAPEFSDPSVVGAAETARLTGWRRRFVRARMLWRTQDPQLLLHRLWRFVQWRLLQP